MEDKNAVMARRVAAAVREAGGRAYYVGGCVRDRLMGKTSKDIDIEVHGLRPDRLEGILDSLGERKDIGESFGIYTLKGYSLDVAMPRKETNRGRGHRDFDICVDPFIGTYQAALRRDFTVNALMEDVLTGEVTDHFNGVGDLRDGVIRHINDGTFVEDPLRVLRAAQFAARFGFTVSPATVELCRRMDLTALPKERIMGETEKALLRSETPSVFFGIIRSMDQLPFWFSQVGALIGVKQNPAFHPEGDVWDHTMKVLDEAAKLREGAEKPLWFMFAALCHDFGKPAAYSETPDGAIHFYSHEKEGVAPAQAFLKKISGEQKLIRYVSNMTLLHMKPNAMVNDGAHVKKFMKTFDGSVCPGDLLLLAKADHLGRAVGSQRDISAGEYEAISAKLEEMLALFKERMSEPCLKGDDLILAGIRPGKELGEALEYAHKLRLAGLSRSDQLKQTLAMLKKTKGGG